MRVCTFCVHVRVRAIPLYFPLFDPNFLFFEQRKMKIGLKWEKGKLRAYFWGDLGLARATYGGRSTEDDERPEFE